MNVPVLRLLPWSLLASALVLTGCRRSAPAATETAAALTVELVSPQSADWPVRIPASGSIEAWEESQIGAEIGGLKLEEVRVNVGDVVTAGQLLARFNAENVKLDLAQAEAALVEAEASLALAQDQARRARELSRTSAVSAQDLLNVETNERRAVARLESSRAQVANQRLRLRYTEVTAPDDGIISVRTATVGTVPTAGTSLFRLIRKGRLEWRAEVNSEALAQIKPGREAELRLPGGTITAGRVRQTSPVVSSANRSGLAYVDVEASADLRAGMFVSGQIVLPSTPALFVPESALVYRDGFQYVMRVTPERRVQQVKVSTGRRLHEGIEIVSGLALEDRIVRSGGSFLSEGDVVRLATP